MDDVNGGWEPVQRVRGHEQVMTQIEQRILSGELSAGDRLPNERELAVMLGMSRPSLRESLRVLEALGVVEIRRGGEGGAFLTGEPGQGFVNVMKMQLALGHFSHDDVLGTRIALESWTCRQAARRATDDDHRRLDEILTSMEDPEITAAEFNALDTAFHVAIAESTSNVLTAHLMQSLRIAINRRMIEVYARLDDWRATAVSVKSEHRAILAAIRSGDSEQAAHLVSDHISSFYVAGRLVLRDSVMLDDREGDA